MGVAAIAAPTEPDARQRPRAVFLDRDGVLNRLVYNPVTGEDESPHEVADLALFPATLPALAQLGALGYQLFIVSNQPSYAKGKATLASIKAIAQAFTDLCGAGGVSFRDQYYCFHHPAGVVPELTGPCQCRKPSPYFLLTAAATYGLDLTQSWMVGDRATDVECGHQAGCRTILVGSSADHDADGIPDFVAADIGAAASLIGTLDQVPPASGPPTQAPRATSRELGSL